MANLTLTYFYKDKALFVSNKKVEFKYNIRFIKNVNDILIILLEVPYNATYLDNVFGVSSSGEIIWRIENVGKACSIKNQLPYENLFAHENDIFVSNFYGRRYFFNPFNGKILSNDALIEECFDIKKITGGFCRKRISSKEAECRTCFSGRHQCQIQGQARRPRRLKPQAPWKP